MASKKNQDAVGARAETAEPVAEQTETAEPVAEQTETAEPMAERAETAAPKEAEDVKTPEGMIEGLEAQGIKPSEIPVDGESPSRSWLYIGPNIKGLIHTGTFFRGTRAEVLAKAAGALEKAPEIQRLIVPGETLARDRERVKTPGNALYETYQALAQREKEAKNA